MTSSSYDYQYTTSGSSSYDTLSGSSWEDELVVFTISIVGTIFEVQRASTDVSTDKGQLLKTKDGKLFIDEDGSGTNIIAITDSAGGTPTFDSSSSWSDGIYNSSWSQKSIAVEQQTDGSFKLAVKNSNTYDNTTNVDWNVYNISSTGILDWNSTWGGITKHEDDFNQDLNGDGGIGLAAALKAVATDVTGARLKRDADNGLYIDDAGTIIAIEDNYGGTPTFDNSSSWNDSYSSGSWSSESVAVEKQSDGSFKLAIKNTNIYDGTTDINWNVYNISSTGILDWNSTWGGITKHEDDFNQDLNGDGGIGLAAALKAVATDVTGARLKRDAENGLYIDVDNDGLNIIPIEDEWGGSPTFDYSSSWSDGIYSSSSSQKSIAVEQQSDGSFKLAVKNSNTYNNTTNVDWNVYNISSTGIWTGPTPHGVASPSMKMISIKTSTATAASVLPLL